jgi:hypothetical protein
VINQRSFNRRFDRNFRKARAMAAKKSYLEHRPVELSEIEHPVLEPA